MSLLSYPRWTTYRVGAVIKDYKMAAGEKSNQEKSVCLQLGTWYGTSMPPNSVVGRRMVGPVKMLGIWLRSNIQAEKDWSEWRAVTLLTRTWSEWWLSLKGRACISCKYVYRTYDHLPPNSRPLYHFVSKQTGALALSIFVEGQWSTCKAFYLLLAPTKGWVKDTLTVDAETCAEAEASVALLDGEHVWSRFVKLMLSQFTSFSELEMWIKHRPMLGAW